MHSEMGIRSQLEAYKKKYYLNKALKGALLWSAGLIAVFLFINALEFSFQLNELGRTILFFSFVLGASVSAYLLFIKHLIDGQRTKNQISNKEVALEIGKHFPEVSDKLLNLIQLEELSASQSELLKASISQKTAQISHVPFVSAIDLSKNKKYLKYVIPPVIAVLLALLIVPELITKSSERIIRFNTAYVPEAPFSFTLENEELIGFKSESYTLNISTEGNSTPENVFIDINGRKIKARNKGNGQFSYTFDRLNNDILFQIEGASVFSPVYELKVVNRPLLESFAIALDFPNYTGLPDESVQNSGNLKIPEGTLVKWKLNTSSTEKADIQLDKRFIGFEKDQNSFVFDSIFSQSTTYKLLLENEFSMNKDSLNFGIDVIKDQYPKISLEQYQDTLLYRDIVFAGQITDDYGFNNLRLKYAYEGENDFKTASIDIEPQLKDQTYYYVFRFDSSYIKAGEELKYFLEVVDNDRLNGYKRSKTGTYSFKIPSKEEIGEEIEKGNQKVEQEIDKTINQAKELKESIEELDERLKTKKELEWQDEKLMNDIMKQKEALSEKLEQLKKENQQNNEKQKQFEPKSENIQQKMQQLQEIMDNVLDEETRKLYDELKELLKQQSDIEEFRDQVEEMKNNSQNLEEDLERTLELFKKLQFDMKLEDNIEQLEEEIKDQEKLQEETEKGDKSNEQLAEEQGKEKEDLEKLQEELEKLNELNQDRKNPEALPEDLNEELDDIQEEQEEAKEALEEEQQESEEGIEETGEQESGEEQEQQQSQQSPSRQKASKAQQRATQKMKQLQQNLQSMQSAMEMEQQQEDIGNLRDLVDNLVTLSFNQETLMNEFTDIRQSDPRFVDLSQQQLKIQDDSKIIQDSLVALSQRVFQISSFVMKELNEMNTQMDGTVQALKEKKISQAVGKQQFTMTSINNLALLLDDILQSMQEQMASQMGGSSKKKGQKNMPMSGISELQKQLSEQIKELKQSGKSGRALSEELAKLAAQQERLRNALESFETGMDGNQLGEKIQKLVEQMEENEMDLLNKNISQQTIERQREILTRMLDAENAVEQRGEDDQREAQTAYDYELSVPESMLEYLKQKEKEVELLRTIPTKLNPYYKKETNKYFNKIKNKD